MPFKSLLTELVENVPGTRGAILLDWEGEAVEQVSRIDDYELKVIGAHKGVILTLLRKAARSLVDDELREVVITTGEARTLILPVTEEYFIVLSLERDGILGRALFESRRCAALLKSEIA